MNALTYQSHLHTHIHTLHTCTYIQDLDGARVEELVLCEKDILPSVGREFQAQPLAFSPLLTVRCINYRVVSGCLSQWVFKLHLALQPRDKNPISSLPIRACVTLCRVEHNQLFCTNCFQLMAVSKCQDIERYSRGIYRNT